MYHYLEGLDFAEKRNILLELLLKNVGIGNRERAQMHIDKLVQIFTEHSKETGSEEIQNFAYELNVLLRHLTHTYKVNSYYSEEVYKRCYHQITDMVHTAQLLHYVPEMVEEYMQLIRSYSRQQYSELIRLCMDYIDVHYAEQITLAGIAACFSVSDSYLSSQFTKETGKNFVSYVNGIRVRYACVLLERLQIPMEKVAELCGFSNSSYFARVFHRQMGITPSHYRKQKQEKEISC